MVEETEKPKEEEKAKPEGEADLKKKAEDLETQS